MKAWVNKISGIDDALIALTMSKRHWDREKEQEIRAIFRERDTAQLPAAAYLDVTRRALELMAPLVKWGPQHPTLLRFIDISVTVEGLHRAGQDDWDSHAARFNNRIIRSSTRLAKYEAGEMSDFYRDKIIPTDEALALLGIAAPDTITKNGAVYTRTVNGYIREDLENDKDARRGLYMLSIPSNFIFKVNLTEWAHVYRERCAAGTANPEVKQLAESIQNQIERMEPLFSRELLAKIRN